MNSLPRPVRLEEDCGERERKKNNRVSSPFGARQASVAASTAEICGVASYLSFHFRSFVSLSSFFIVSFSGEVIQKLESYRQQQQWFSVIALSHLQSR